MTQQDEDQPNREAAGRLRIAEITTLFADMRAMMVMWLGDAGPAAKATSKQMLDKINELQSAHLLVIRAEEAFHDKFGHGEIADGIDYDAARDAIGRELDRLRAAVEAGYLSEGPDDGAD